MNPLKRRTLDIPLEPYVETVAPPQFPTFNLQPPEDNTNQDAGQLGSAMGGLGRDWWNKRRMPKVMGDIPKPGHEM